MNSGYDEVTRTKLGLVSKATKINRMYKIVGFKTPDIKQGKSDS